MHLERVATTTTFEDRYPRRSLSIVEIGVDEGDLPTFLFSLLPLGRLNYTGIDPYYDNEDGFFNAQERLHKLQHCTLLRGTTQSPEIVTSIPDASLDFVWVDGDLRRQFTPLRLSPTFGYTKAPAQCRSLVSRRVVETSLGGVPWRGGGVDMRKIRVGRLRGVVWVDVSRGRLGGHVPKRGCGGVVAPPFRGGDMSPFRGGDMAPFRGGDECPFGTGYTFCGQDSILVDDEEPPACVCPSVVTPSGCCCIVWGGPAERGTKAYGSKYRPRKITPMRA